MAVRYIPLPAPADIVWCRYPYIQGIPSRKPRPSLVLRTAAKYHAVEVACGTSQKTERLFKGEFALDPSDAGFELSGLTTRTKFNVCKRVKLISDDEWFAPTPGVYGQSPPPRLGALHADFVAAAAKALAQIG